MIQADFIDIDKYSYVHNQRQKAITNWLLFNQEYPLWFDEIYVECER